MGPISPTPVRRTISVFGFGHGNFPQNWLLIRFLQRSAGPKFPVLTIWEVALEVNPGGWP
jgi:hypothetical protein